MTARSLGLDFGTTNTVLAWAHPHRPIANGLATIGLREDIDSWVVTPQAAKP
jgi:molecular chaperone DnaK (HSP70)